jgi:hypothetical protein
LTDIEKETEMEGGDTVTFGYYGGEEGIVE